MLAFRGVRIGASVLFVLLFAAHGGTARAADPPCFLAPPALTAQPAGDEAIPACRILFKVLSTTAARDIAWLPGSGLNANLGLSEGGFPAMTYVLQFRVSKAFNDAFKERDELVRFAVDEGRARGGSWWTPLEFVSDTASVLVPVEQIATQLALPRQSVPRVVAYASGVAEGTLGYVGIVAPAFGREGGGVQFWFPSEPVYTDRAVPIVSPTLLPAPRAP